MTTIESAVQCEICLQRPPYEDCPGGDCARWIALQKDAERYRWLKANENSDLATELCLEVPADDWDAAIDRAIIEEARK